MPDFVSPTGRRAPRASHGHAGRALAVPVLALATGWTGLAVPAHAADQATPSGTTTTQEPAGVRVGGRARITKDGSVRVHLRARCPATYQAFELDVAVFQDGAFGSLTQLAPPAVVVCDGTVHSRTALVAPEAGSFGRGPATVNVFVGFYDTETGRDTEATTTATVRLRACGARAAS